MSIIQKRKSRILSHEKNNSWTLKVRGWIMEVHRLILKVHIYTTRRSVSSGLKITNLMHERIVFFSRKDCILFCFNKKGSRFIEREPLY